LDDKKTSFAEFNILKNNNENEYYQNNIDHIHKPI